MKVNNQAWLCSLLGFIHMYVLDGRYLKGHNSFLSSHGKVTEK